MHYAAQVAHYTPTLHVLPPIPLRHKRGRPWGGHPNTAAQGEAAWCTMAVHAEARAAKRRAYEAKLSTRLRRLVRSVRRVCGL